MFEKRHYEAIAKLLKERGYGKNRALQMALADLFASDNPRFDEIRFYEACGAE